MPSLDNLFPADQVLVRASRYCIRVPGEIKLAQVECKATTIRYVNPHSDDTGRQGWLVVIDFAALVRPIVGVDGCRAKRSRSPVSGHPLVTSF